jgi:tryptophan 7-halogenase
MKKIVIIGGGTAGWLTSLVVNKFWKNTTITIVESSKIGILGAGEGGTSNFGKMLSLLDINQNEFFEKTKSTVKGGLHLYNWTGKNELSKHLFFGDNPNETNKSYAYHFDARLVAKYFKEIALSRGVEWIDGEVSEIKKENDKITELHLKDNRVIELDFVFDCSGFSKIIVDGIHKEEWISYTKYLMMNKAIVFFLPQENEYKLNDKTYTEMLSMDCGWMFKIPLQHRWGCGYVFNDKYLTVEDAKKEVENHLGQEVILQNVFNFNPGTHKRSWISNSISIGLSYGFIEPLEATSLMSTIMQLKKLIDINFDEGNMDKYNKWCYQINEQNLNFIRYHYLCERDDTQFWRDCTSMPIPNKLKKILDKNNSIIAKNDVELLKLFELEDITPNELTFFVKNYLTIFKKNKKSNKKELI